MNQKNIIRLTIALILAALAAPCNLDQKKETASEKKWRIENGDWYEAQKALTDDNGNLFYQVVVPVWNPSAQVLMHWFNDRAATAGNLVPLATSSVSCKYQLKLYDGTVVDSSYERRDSTYTAPLPNLISGWQIALQQMHVGDSVRVVVPYTEGYGITATGSIPAYSSLQFEIKLKDIPDYELPY